MRRLHTYCNRLTGEPGNRELSCEENTELRLNFSVELLRNSLADTLTKSSLDHANKDDVIQLLRSGKLNPHELFNELIALRNDLSSNDTVLEPSNGSDLASVKFPSRRISKKRSSNAA